MTILNLDFGTEIWPELDETNALTMLSVLTN